MGHIDRGRENGRASADNVSSTIVTGGVCCVIFKVGVRDITPGRIISGVLPPVGSRVSACGIDLAGNHDSCISSATFPYLGCDCTRSGITHRRIGDKHITAPSPPSASPQPIPEEPPLPPPPKSLPLLPFVPPVWLTTPLPPLPACSRDVVPAEPGWVPQEKLPPFPPFPPPAAPPPPDPHHAPVEPVPPLPPLILTVPIHWELCPPVPGWLVDPSGTSEAPLAKAIVVVPFFTQLSPPQPLCVLLQLWCPLPLDPTWMVNSSPGDTV